MPLLNRYLSYSDDDLMYEIRAGNMAAFDSLYERYSRKIYRFALKLIKSQEDAENIVQEVFLSLFENRNKIEKCSSVKSFIYTITHNFAISQIRKRMNESHFIEYLKFIQTYDQPKPDQQLEYLELVEKLNEIVNSLPERQREIYRLHREMGFKYKEIARRMNIAVSTVENQMSGAIKKIRHEVRNFSSLLLLLFILW